VRSQRPAQGEVVVTDHSKGLKIAGGINEEQLEQQACEISAVNDSLRIRGRMLRVLHSIEVNLSPSGDVDMEPSSLSKLDVVLGCFHSSLRKKSDQTDRYLAALHNPTIQILGHPRGRIYNFRLGLSADWACEYFRSLPNLIKRSRSILILTARI